MSRADALLIEAVVVHFGSRARAEHIVRCGACRHDEHGDFRPCPRCPRPGEQRPVLAPLAAPAPERAALTRVDPTGRQATRPARSVPDPFGLPPGGAA